MKAEYSRFQSADTLQMEEFVRNYLLRICNVLYREQIVVALKNQFALDRNKAEALLEIMQKRGWIIQTGDGYVLTRGVYEDLSGDRKFEHLRFNTKYALEKIDDGWMKSLKEERSIREAMWIVVDFLPDVQYLSACQGLWNLMFVVPADPKKKLPDRLYEVAALPEGMEDVYKVALVDSAQELKKQDPEMWTSPDRQKQIRRILLLHDGETLSEVPKGIGIMAVAVIDGKVPKNYRILKVYPEEEAWAVA